MFDMMDATALNKHVQELMPGLSVKVFRTYNASITLDGLLYAEQADSETVEAKKVDYDRANKEVCHAAGCAGATWWQRSSGPLWLSTSQLGGIILTWCLCSKLVGSGPGFAKMFGSCSQCHVCMSIHPYSQLPLSPTRICDNEQKCCSQAHTQFPLLTIILTLQA